MTFTTSSAAVAAITTTERAFGSVVDPNRHDSSKEKKSARGSTGAKKKCTGGGKGARKDHWTPPMHKIDAMFGGTLEKSLGSGWAVERAVVERFYPNPHLRKMRNYDAMRLKDFLLSIGMVETKATRNIFRYAENPSVPGLRMEMFALRTIHNILEPMDCSEPLLDSIETNGETHAFQNGITARYYSTVFQTVVDGESQIITDAEKKRLILSFEDWFGSVPANHTRFYHGTATGSVRLITRNGFDQNRYDKFSDFGPGLYCTRDASVAFGHAVMKGYSCSTPGKRGCIMAFDVDTRQDSEYDRKCKYRFSDQNGNMDGWTQVVASSGTRFGPLTNVGLFEDADIIIGPTSDPSIKKPEPVRPYQDQYCFRRAEENLLLRDPTKVKVAVFDAENDDDHGDY